MKKFILVAIAALLFSSQIKAIDSEYSYYGLSVNFGLNVIDNGQGFSLQNDEAMTMVGMDLGFYMQQQLYKRFVLVSGFKYQFSTDWEYDQTKIGRFTSECNMFMWNHAFKIPVKLGFSTHLPRNWMFSVYAGPSLDFNFATTQKFKNSAGDYEKMDYVNGTYKTNLLDTEDGSNDNLKVLKMFDVPIGFGITVKHKYVGIKFEYEYGLINRYKGPTLGDFTKAKWNSHQISLGAVFTF